MNMLSEIPSTNRYFFWKDLCLMIINRFYLQEWNIHHPTLLVRPKIKREEAILSGDIIKKFDDSERIKNVCNFYGEKLRMKEKNLRLQFMIDSVHRVAYCRHGKVC